MNYVLKPPANPSFKRVGVEGSIFSTQHLTSKTEFLIITTEAGHDTTIIEHECDFSYFILEGSGEFTINGKAELCSVGNLVVIPAGHQFTYRGKLKMLLNVTPPFTPEQEETLTNI